MNISIIVGSHREKSESARIANIIKNNLYVLDKTLDLNLIDLGIKKLPLWGSKTENLDKTWKDISNLIKASEGFVFVVPEYGGMATPQIKNFFLYCNNGELAHKPGLIVAISSGSGGAYPVADLRSSSYKNTHIMWIPENIIIRNVEQFVTGSHGDLIPEWLDARIKYTLNLLLAYSTNMKPVRKIINRKDYGNGM